MTATVDTGRFPSRRKIRKSRRSPPTCGSFGSIEYLGLNKALKTFQISQDIIFSIVPWPIQPVYLYDFIVLLKDFKSFLDHLDNVLTFLNGKALSFKLKSASFSISPFVTLNI